MLIPNVKKQNIKTGKINFDNIIFEGNEEVSFAQKYLSFYTQDAAIKNWLMDLICWI